MIAIKLAILACIIIQHSASEQQNSTKEYKPIEAFSIILDEKTLTKNIKNNQMKIYHQLYANSNSVAGCQIVGSISEINLKASPNVQFYFNYLLVAHNSTVVVDIFARNNNGEPFSSNLLIVIDFFIARFPKDYIIRTFNITNYQEHVHYKAKNRQNNTHQLVFFLNGFNNISLSGNITHGYQSPSDMYTVHYMSDEGEQKHMGWKDSDYLYYTILIIQDRNMIQKFKIKNRIYSLDYQNNIRYFYGIKGTTQQQFIGSFYQRLKGVNFKVDLLGENQTYGIVFLPFPNLDFQDRRMHDSRSYFAMIGGIIYGVFVILCLISASLLRKKFGYLTSIFVKKKLQFNQQQQTEEVLQEQTPNLQVEQVVLNDTEKQQNKDVAS